MSKASLFATLLLTGLCFICQTTQAAQTTLQPLQVAQVLDDFSSQRNGTWWDVDGTVVYQRELVPTDDPHHFSTMRVSFKKGNYPWSFFAFAPHPHIFEGHRTVFTDLVLWIRSAGRLRILIKVEGETSQSCEKAFSILPDEWVILSLRFTSAGMSCASIKNILFFAEPGQRYKTGEFLIANLMLASRDFFAYIPPHRLWIPVPQSVLRWDEEKFELLWGGAPEEPWPGLFEVGIWDSQERTCLRRYWTARQQLTVEGLGVGVYRWRVRCWTHLPREWGFSGIAGEWSRSAELTITSPPNCDDDLKAIINYYSDIIRACHILSKPLAEACAFLDLARCEENHGVYSQAIENYSQALHLFRSIPDRAGEADALLGIGSCHRSQGDHTQAISFYNQALEIYRDLTNYPGQAGALLGLGICYLYVGNCTLGRTMITEARGIYRDRLHDSVGEANAILALGDSYKMSGDFQRAIALYTESLPLYVAAQEVAGEANAHMAIATCEYFLGNYRNALDAYEYARALKHRLEDHQGEANCLLGQGVCYESLRQFRRTISCYEQALSLYRSVTDMAGIANSLMGLATCRLLQRDFHQALDTYLQALAIYKNRLNNPGGQANAFLGIADCYFSLEAYDLALENYHYALTLFIETGNHQGVVRSLSDIGRTLLARGLPEEAITTLNECLTMIWNMSLPEGYKYPAPEILWRASYNLGQALALRGDVNSAIAAWTQAVEVVEALRAYIGRATWIPIYMEERLSLFHTLCSALLALGDANNALSYAERAKARTLVDMMETAMTLTPTMVPADLQTVGALIRQLSVMPESLLEGSRGGRPADERPGFQEVARMAHHQYQALLTELEETNPVLSSTMALEPTQVTFYLQQVRRSLGKRVVALEYFVAGEETLLWVITEEGIQTASRLGVSREELVQRVQGFHRQLVERVPQGEEALRYVEALRLGRGLYDL
ncbi:hypothetical protein DRN74_06630, partial [Candidatus Micrarchaeota archaeon]